MRRPAGGLGPSRRQNQSPSVAILNAGGMNHTMKQEAYSIDEDMTLLAFDLVGSNGLFERPIVFWNMWSPRKILSLELEV
jgi:hypothetical protein